MSPNRQTYPNLPKGSGAPYPDIDRLDSKEGFAPESRSKGHGLDFWDLIPAESDSSDSSSADSSSASSISAKSILAEFQRTRLQRTLDQRDEFSGLEFSGLDFSGLKFSGLEFSGLDLKGLEERKIGFGVPRGARRRPVGYGKARKSSKWAREAQLCKLRESEHQL